MSLPHVRGRTLDLGAGTAKYKPDILPFTSTYTTYDFIQGPHIDVVGDVHELKAFPNESFDTVICTEVLEHVQEPWRVIEEIARVLAPNGRCILTTPFLLPFHADPHDYYRYTIEGAAHLFERTGLVVIDRAKYGNLMMVIAEAFKFSFCNPYLHHHPEFVRRNIFRVIYRFLKSFSTHTSQDTLFYSGTYIVAEKK